jgi:phosphatidylserine synthase
MTGFWNIPNSLTVVRIGITVGLYPLVWLGLREWLLSAFVIASATDTLDGYLARRLKQTSYIGMRLDSFADYFLIGSSLIWAYRLVPGLFRENRASWTVMAVALVVPQIIGLVKLGKNVGFHLYSTKAASWSAFFLFLHALVAGHYSRALLALLVISVIVKSAEEAWICVRVPDPYADLRPSVLSYIRRRE